MALRVQNLRQMANTAGQAPMASDLQTPYGYQTLQQNRQMKSIDPPVSGRTWIARSVVPSQVSDRAAVSASVRCL